MEEFLKQIDKLCFEYGYEIRASMRRTFDDDGNLCRVPVIEITGKGEKTREVIYFDGDGIN